MADRYRILLAEDEVKLGRLLRNLLENRGYEVTVRENGQDAFAAVLESAPDLLLTDLMMPGMDGLTLARNARSVCPDLPVVIMTAYSTRQTAVQALQEGISGYIEKPCAGTELLATVARILRQRSLEREIARLIEDLKVANAELTQHRERLTIQVRDAETDLAAANAALARRLRDLEIVHEIRDMTALVRDVPLLLPLACRLVRDKRGEEIAVLLRDDGAATVTVRGQAGPAAQDPVPASFPADTGLFARVLGAGRPVRLPGAGDEDALTPAERAFLGAGPALVVPVRRGEEAAGLLVARRPAGADPFAPEDENLLHLIALDLGTALEKIRLFALNEASWIQTLGAAVNALEARDRYLRRHSRRVRALAGRIGRSLNLPADQLGWLDTGARLHDLGKIGVDDAILRKPAALDRAEMETMRRHPLISCQIVEGAAGLTPVLPIIRHHHERWDGAGYPDGLGAHRIPFLSQIVSVADAFDAMTSPRPYRGALPREEALHRISEASGTQFNPFLVAVFADVAAALERDGFEPDDEVG